MSAEETSSGAAAHRRAFEEIAPLYDQLMRGVPYDDWIKYLHKLLDLRRAHPRTALDVACGTGNVTERLAEQGWRVAGVDISAEMVAEARRKAVAQGLAIDYYVQDAADLDLGGQRFDLCVSLFDSLNYITDPTRLARAVSRVAAHLQPDGLFIFDLNTEYALANHFFDQDNLKSGDRLRYDWDSEYSAASRLCKVTMRFWYRRDDGSDYAFRETHWQYAYRTEDVLRMLLDAGFTDVATYQAYTTRPPSRTSDRIFYVARKSGAAPPLSP